MEEIKTWFRDYKTWEGGKTNKFLFSGDVLSVEQSMEIIKESNLAYKNLRDSKTRTVAKGYWMGEKEATQKN